MDPSKVKLTFIQAIKPTIAVVVASAFIRISVVMLLVLLENAFVAHWMPILIANSRFLDGIVSFGLALIIQVAAALPFVLIITWWDDEKSESGRDLYRRFRSDLSHALLKKRIEVLATAEEEMLK